ncbi:MAG: siroheme decarboxylase subunit alpha [Candidatus Methanospirareceae archaeon]
MRELEEIEKELLQILQDDFPLERRPWAKIAEKLGISEDEVLERTRKLFEEGIIRRISPVLDARRVGLCASTLIAMRVPEEKMEEVVNVVNKYENVTHNYEREHDYNLWFTLLAPDEAELRRIVEEIKRKAGVSDVDILDLPTNRYFKIDVRFQFKNKQW